MIEELIIYLLLAIGMSQLWSHSKIFSYVRIFIVKIPYIRDALLCPVCSSFWIGVVASLVFNPLISFIPIFSNVVCGIINYLICGLLFKKDILNDD